MQVGHGPRVVIVQDILISQFPQKEKTPITGGGRVRCEEVRDTCQKILIKLANDTNVRVARAFFNPVKIPLKTDTTVFFIIYMRATQN